VNLLEQAKGKVAPAVLGAMQRYDFTKDAGANVRQVLLREAPTPLLWGGMGCRSL